MLSHLFIFAFDFLISVISTKDGNYTKISRKKKSTIMFVTFILENYFTLYFDFVWRESKHFLPLSDIFIAIN